MSAARQTTGRYDDVSSATHPGPDLPIQPPRWYAVKAKRWRANEACLSLSRAGVELWRPRLFLRDPNRSGSGVRERKGKTQSEFSPGGGKRLANLCHYFFVRIVLTPALFQEIEHTTAVAGFVRRKKRMPVPISDAEMRAIQSGAITHIEQKSGLVLQNHENGEPAPAVVRVGSVQTSQAKSGERNKTLVNPARQTSGSA